MASSTYVTCYDYLKNARGEFGITNEEGENGCLLQFTPLIIKHSSILLLIKHLRWLPSVIRFLQNSSNC